MEDSVESVNEKSDLAPPEVVEKQFEAKVLKMEQLELLRR